MQDNMRPVAKAPAVVFLQLWKFECECISSCDRANSVTYNLADCFGTSGTSSCSAERMVEFDLKGFRLSILVLAVVLA